VSSSNLFIIMQTDLRPVNRSTAFLTQGSRTTAQVIRLVGAKGILEPSRLLANLD
jgi:hypothetical protein